MKFPFTPGEEFAINWWEEPSESHLNHVLFELTEKQKGFHTWMAFHKDIVIFEGEKQVYPKVLSASREIKLAVKWESQMNSRMPEQAARMCFSSSVWMAMAYISKDFVKLFPNDDDYLRSVLKRGDTTQAHAHISALKENGFDCQYSQNGRLEDIVESLEVGLPCCLGILHRGSVYAPTGGGHWLCCGGVNVSRDKFLMFDPFGSVLDNPPYSGPIERGNGYWCPKSVLDRRWTVDSESDGWFMTFFGN